MYKKFLNLGVLLIAILALSEVGTAETAAVTTTATMGEHIWISSSGPVSLTIVPDTTVTNTLSVVSVKTNKNYAWTVTASINNAGGKLVESTSAIPLVKPLVLTVGATDYPLVTTQTIYDDPGTDHKTGGTGRQISPTFKQESVYDDAPGTYTGIVTFTAAYKP